MTELFFLCFSQVLRALLTWIPVFLGAVVLLGITISVWSGRRFRRLAATRDGASPRSRVWTARLLLIATQAVVLPIIALGTAIPFALQQGAASAIESASPRILDWGVKTGTYALKQKLAIADDAAIVDLGELAPVLRHVPPVATRARGFLNSLSIVPRLTNTAFFRAMDSAVDEATRTNLRVTWDDLFASAHKKFGALWGGQARIVSSLLRASSLHFLHFLAVTVGIVDLLCVIVILALTPIGGNPTRGPGVPA